MSDVRVMVLRAAGINCDEEVMHAWHLAGAQPALVHINRLAEAPSMLDEFQIVTIPGGFSYGDDIAAGTILAQRIMLDLAEPIRRFVEGGGGLLGICNGFQVLVKTGLLPGSDAGPSQVTVTYNDSARFEARWVRLEVCTDRCAFLTARDHGAEAAEGDSRGLKPAAQGARRYLEMPVEHAEGKVVTVAEDVAAQLESRGQIAVRYVDQQGRCDQYPSNPNGSIAGIAGLCDSTGRIFGLMPHPDRHFDHAHHPLWTRRNPEGPPDGLTVFQNAVSYWSR